MRTPWRVRKAEIEGASLSLVLGVLLGAKAQREGNEYGGKVTGGRGP